MGRDPRSQPSRRPATAWGEITNGRVATGINHAAQQRSTNFTLIVGILLGVAGGALVAAVQEALHD